MITIEAERKLKSVLSAHYRPGARCLRKTRVTLLDDVNVWLRGTGNKKTAWVHGFAGSGKSALLNSIAKNLEDAHIPFTFFACKRDDVKRSDVRLILPALCYDLMRSYDDYRDTISDIVDQLTGRSVLNQSELLLGKSPSYSIISPVGAQRPSVHVILVDALDECKVTSQRRALTKCLRNLADAVPWIKVIITSRRESDIDGVLGSHMVIYRIDINSEKWNTDEDIRRFIKAEMKRLKLGHLSKLETPLVERASGLFVWCTTLFRYVERCGNKEMVLRSALTSPLSSNEPLASIYDLYHYIISSSIPCHYTDDKELAHKILGVILVATSRRPLSITAMSELIDMKKRCSWVTTITRRLHAILYEDPDMLGAVRVCHSTVLDFLEILFKGKETISLASVHTLLFKTSMSVVKAWLNSCRLEDSIRRNKDAPVLPACIACNMPEAVQYGISFWVSHLEESDVTDRRESARKVFTFLNSVKGLYWVQALSLIDGVDRGIVVLRDCGRIFTVRLSYPLPNNS